ncbi:T9SS sorting signal type C domain-containing protein [Flavobacterium terrigena]|uniref:Por secretion system C-terminal sorting domain-containing protein n=1 Tax=Flavobacterium terrigena TaxID=402734 RepID=A0A1H6SHZ0_9FLAO|nr:T9SS sorting signal type C domain-containing protein [Flavobacterium terrigena]SEI67568.1 Por secretion system C-terminal sorting domain-containing protein [Flavobacterium terrigena]
MNKIYLTPKQPHQNANQILKINIRKKQFSLFLLMFLLVSVKILGQSVGDYRSVNPGGPWTTLGSWEYYNGSSWIAASTYPGQNPTGTGVVTILAGHSISIGTTGINTGVIGSIIISGNLALTGTNTGGNGTDYVFNTQLISVTPLLGTITFIDKIDLILPNNAVLSVTYDITPNPDYYGLIGDCNHNQDIHIGSSIYAYCNGGGTTALTFQEVMAGDGTLNSSPSSNTPVCEGSQINLSGSYLGTFGTTVTYSWAIIAPGGGNSSSALQNPVIPNALVGTYTATLTCTTTYSGNTYNNYEAISILVNPRPGTISIGTITQPTCALPTGSVQLNNLPAGNWTINPGAIAGSGSSYTVSGLTPGSYSFTATNSGGCTSVATSPVNIISSSKVWNGSISSDWFAPSNWTPNNVPNATDCVSITNIGNSPVISGPSVAYAYAITVPSNGSLEIVSTGILQVTDVINVNANGIFNIRNNGSLIQINNVSNIGNINMERTAFVDHSDYVYWSSPVAGFNSANISIFSSNSNLYKWVPTIPGNGIGAFGNWAYATETMILGKGYAERGLNGAPQNSPVNFTSTFTGVPNNGNITTPISRGTYNTIGTYPSPYSPTNATQDDDNWNLLGNPYASSISADAFLTANATNIMGFVNIWRHGIAPSAGATDPFYGNYAYNYDASDYLTYNLSGPSSPLGFDGYIGAGQGFFVLMNPLSPLTSTTAVFNNTMRSSSYRNDQFYKTANTNTADYPEGRIWIDLVSSTTSISTLIAYVNGATNQKDQLYDAQVDLKAPFSIYSLLEGYDRNIIQGRSLPFDQNDQVPLAIKVPSSGSYTFFIKGIDGLLSNQNIYLEDKLLNIIYNLRIDPYTFTASQGETLDRFVLRFTNNILSTDQNVFSDQVTIFTNNNINVKSTVQSINEIMIYDILGKNLVDRKNINQQEIILSELKATTGVLIVKVKLENDVVITKKVVY